MTTLDLNTLGELIAKGYVIVDARQPADFCDGFIKGAVSLPFGENFIIAFQNYLKNGQQVVLVADDKDRKQITTAIRYAGIEQPAGFLQQDYQAWKEAGLLTDMLITIEPDEFAIDYKYDEFYLIDVRTADEFAETHLEDAENIPLEEIENMTTELELGGNYYLYGNSFSEAVTGGSLLKQNGFERVRVVTADYQTLHTSGLPVYTPKKKGNSSEKFSNN